jgi:hypothetical protein
MVGGLLAALIPEGAANARPLTRLSYSELIKESDAVVIGTALSTVAHPKQEIVEELKSVKDHIECVLTTFRIDGVLKGTIEGDRASLVHYRSKRAKDEQGVPRPLFIDARLVRFDGHGPIIGRNPLTGNPVRGAAPSYLLFLKAAADGSFTPVTGQFDPDDSARRLEPSDLDRRNPAEPREPASEK